MDTYMFRIRYFRLAPLTIPVVASYVKVGFDITKGEIIPVKIYHDLRFWFFQMYSIKPKYQMILLIVEFVAGEYP